MIQPTTFNGDLLGNATSATKWAGSTNDIGTLNTTDTWVPVISNAKWQHRVIPIDYNKSPSELTVGGVICIPWDSNSYRNVVVTNGNHGLYYAGDNKVQLNYSTGTLKIQTLGSDYNEGIRLSGSTASDSWSIICFGCDPAQGRGTHDNQWTIGRNDSNSFVFRKGATDLTYINASGQITANNFITTSDRRLKKNITEITDAEKSLKLNFYEFDYRDNDNHSAGHIAQEVKEVLPEFVNQPSENEYMALDYTGIHTLQIKALLDKIERLERRVEELEKNN